MPLLTVSCSLKHLCFTSLSLLACAALDNGLLRFSCLMLGSPRCLIWFPFQVPFLSEHYHLEIFHKCTKSQGATDFTSRSAIHKNFPQIPARKAQSANSIERCLDGGSNPSDFLLRRLLFKKALSACFLCGIFLASKEFQQLRKNPRKVEWRDDEERRCKHIGARCRTLAKYSIGGGSCVSCTSDEREKKMRPKSHICRSQRECFCAAR